MIRKTSSTRGRTAENKLPSKDSDPTLQRDQPAQSGTGNAFHFAKIKNQSHARLQVLTAANGIQRFRLKQMAWQPDNLVGTTDFPGEPQELSAYRTRTIPSRDRRFDVDI